MLDTLSIDDFLPLVGTPLAVRHPGGEFALVLVAATPIDNPSPRAKSPFRLSLRSPEKRLMTQGLCRLVHPVKGEIELFMVPLGPDRDGTNFEIILN